MPPPTTSRARRINDARVVWQVGQHDRLGASRNNAVLEIDRFVSVETEAIRGLELCCCLDDADLALLRHGREATGQLADDLVLPVTELLGIDLGLAEDDAMVRHGRRFVDHFGRVQQCLGRNAPDVEANTPEIGPALDQDDIHAQVGGTKRGRVTTGSGTDDDDLRTVGGVTRGLCCGLDFPGRHATGIFGRSCRRVAGLDCRRIGVGRFDRDERVALRDTIAHADVDRDDRAGLFRGHIHRGLVGLERNQGIFDGDDVTRGRDDLDDFDVLEVAQVRDREFDGHYGIARNSESTLASC
jgi:hypothetical protein